MITGKTLLDHTDLFSPNNYKKNDKIRYTYDNVAKENADL